MRFYVSHSIRGKKGENASNLDMRRNCDKIKKIVKSLRKEYPDVEFYLPAESEPFVLPAYRKGYLTEKQILELDCIIIDGCDAVLIYVPSDDELQGGRLVEHNYALAAGVPVYIFRGIVDAVYHVAHQIMR